MLKETHKKSKEIFNHISQMPEHIECLKTGEFYKLAVYGIQFTKKAGSVETLEEIHFDTTHTEFLINRDPWWFAVKEKEYERIVDELHKAIIK